MRENSALNNYWNCEDFAAMQSYNTYREKEDFFGRKARQMDISHA